MSLCACNVYGLRCTSPAADGSDLCSYCRSDHPQDAPESDSAKHGLAEGLARKQQGQQLALEAAVPWRDQAKEAIAWLADNRATFTSEDLIDKIGLPNGTIGTNKNNAVGAVMTAAAKAGLIRAVGYTRSTRPSSNGAVIAEWEGV